MSYTLTVDEAAKILKISRGRVYQLINKHALKAEKFGRTWMVDDMSVTKRSSSQHRAGRPAKINPANAEPFILMNREHKVLEFECVTRHANFTSIGKIYDPKRAPLGVVSPRGKSASTDALAFWWAHRAIPSSRRGLAKHLQELDINADALPFGSLGLSLSDQYWICPSDSNLHWSDVNYFENDFDFQKDGWLTNIGLSSPDNTSEGELDKKWAIKNGKRILLKGSGPLNQEPINELLATRLHTLLLKEDEYVPYWIEQLSTGIASACRCFINNNEEYIPAFYVRKLKRKPNHLSEYRHFIECCVTLGIEDAEEHLSKMFFCDDIIANHDRHWRNFGIIRNVETLQCRMAPIFDSGSSLWCDTPTSQLAQKNYRFSSKPFHEDPNRQLMLIDDLSWVDTSKLEEFHAEVKDTLKSNGIETDRAEHIADAVLWRIQRIKALLN